MRVAAIELAERRVRMLVAEEGQIIARDEAVPPSVATIGPAERNRFVALLETLRARAIALDTTRIVALATGRLRTIRGIGALQAVVPGRLGFELVAPSPIEERRLAYQGVARAETGRLAVVHFTEQWADFVVGEGRTILFEQTIPLGLAALERTFAGDAATPGEHAARLVDAITTLTGPVARRVRDLAPVEIVYAADPESATAGVVLGVIGGLLGADRSRLVHRPLAEGLLACVSAVAQTEADPAHGHQELGIADLAAES